MVGAILGSQEDGGADLSGAYLSSANMVGASLRDVTLEGADLTDAAVFSEQWVDCKFLKCATMPDGTRHD
jgi:uncharacterized protein YjbI with pentapeptide repeats